MGFPQLCRLQVQGQGVGRRSLLSLSPWRSDGPFRLFPHVAFSLCSQPCYLCVHISSPHKDTSHAFLGSTPMPSFCNLFELPVSMQQPHSEDWTLGLSCTTLGAEGDTVQATAAPHLPRPGSSDPAPPPHTQCFSWVRNTKEMRNYSLLCNRKNYNLQDRLCNYSITLDLLEISF